VAIATLGLAIAANTVVFSIVNGSSFAAAVRGARSASSTQTKDPGQSDDYGGFSWREYSAIAKDVHTLESAALATPKRRI